MSILNDLKSIFEFLNITYFAEHLQKIMQTPQKISEERSITKNGEVADVYPLLNVLPIIVRAQVKWLERRQGDIALLKPFTEQEFAEVSLLNSSPDRRERLFRDLYDQSRKHVERQSQLPSDDIDLYEKTLNHISSMSNQVKGIHPTLKEFWRQLEVHARKEFENAAPDLYFSKSGGGIKEKAQWAIEQIANIEKSLQKGLGHTPTKIEKWHEVKQYAEKESEKFKENDSMVAASAWKDLEIRAARLEKFSIQEDALKNGSITEAELRKYLKDEID